MRFGSLVLAGLAGLAGFAPSVVADWLETTWTCDADFFVICNHINTPYQHFHTDFGSYDLNSVNDGCHATGVPGTTESCIDWQNTIAHFKYWHQSYKCCLKKNAAGRFFHRRFLPGS
ncbi:hypothetical protein N657DRAFT_643478 [Parathielavia appendiculata]|uniref:Uncharacterized protein n=1 Tax=Parathielavia appendiculata TaxID=2587402 RepID=A0AAN6U1N1_9PEZI|nr:hypothetical protein N657DRAFT_643478 [Parathielavia appendiculata]